MSDSEGKPAKLRVFLALHPPDLVIDNLTQLQARLQENLAKAVIRWAKPKQLHITTQFLGSIDEAMIPPLQNVVFEVSARHRPLTVDVAGVGCFPSARQPRVIWAGLIGRLEVLAALKEDLDVSLQSLGYVPEKRAYKPHITLARVNTIKARETKLLQNCLVDYKTRAFGEWTIDRVDLMQSILSPAGARYNLLTSFPLNQTP